MAIRIPADITDAFSHLMMVGLASILEDDDSGRHLHDRGSIFVMRN